MDDDVEAALVWIVKILNDRQVPYRIGGGVAANFYGAERPINDIDISVSGQYFETIIPLVSDYIVTGPKHYQNDKWDCVTLSLNYHGQDIDLTDVDTLKMSDKTKTKWIQNKELYDQHPDITVEIADVSVTLMHPRTLIAYKQELDGEHQAADIVALEQYIYH